MGRCSFGPSRDAEPTSREDRAAAPFRCSRFETPSPVLAQKCLGCWWCSVGCRRPPDLRRREVEKQHACHLRLVRRLERGEKRKKKKKKKKKKGKKKKKKKKKKS